MNILRAFFLRHRATALVLVAVTLFMKALVPAGYMIGQDSRVLTVEICHDGLGGTSAKQVVIPIKRDGGDSSAKQDKGECPFSALSMASLSGPDSALLELALAFILVLGFAPVRYAHPEQGFRLRPPLRGPPALV